MTAQKKGSAKNVIAAKAAGAATPKAAPKAMSKTATKRSKPIKVAKARIETIQVAEDALGMVAAEGMMAPAARLIEASAEQAREVYARVQTASEQIRQTMAETATLTTRGAVEINGKVFNAWRAQSEIALSLWRRAMAAHSISEAVDLQASGARQAYETATAHWKDVAETTGRWLGATVKPLQSTLLK